MTNDSPISAVIFDMDGVIFNTETIFRKAWKNTFEELGFEFDEQLFARVAGHPSAVSFAKLVEKYRGVFDCEQFWVRKNQEFSRLRVEALSYRSGFERLLAAIQSKNLKIAIATSSPIREVRRNFELLPTHAKVFDIIIAAEDVKEHKPSAECYVRACECLDSSPSMCLVVEDTILGATAGLNAGCTVILAPEAPINNAEVSNRVLATVLNLDDIVPIIQLAC